MDFTTKKFLDYNLFADDLRVLSNMDKIVINTINQYSFCIADKDVNFKNALLQSDVLLPDGIGVVGALYFLRGEKIKKIAGADCHQFLLKELNRKGGSCFYLGSSKCTLQKIEEKTSLIYPNIRISSYSPPFKQTFSDEDNTQMLRSINSFNPDVLFIGMTAPKQELWACENRDRIQAKTICSIGAVFDFYAGTVQRPNKIWISFGLEWLVRLIKEPKRLWKRYIFYGYVFIKKIIRLKFDSQVLIRKNW